MAHMAFLMPLMLQAANPAAPAPAVAAQPAQPQLAANETTATNKNRSDKLICKRQARTGSLAGVERICRTKEQWQALSDRTREEWQELQGTKGSTHGG